MSFDSKTAHFELTYQPNASIVSPTEIAVPGLRYPAGFDVSVSDGLSWAMAEGRVDVLAVSVEPGATPTKGTVKIVPK